MIDIFARGCFAFVARFVFSARLSYVNKAAEAPDTYLDKLWQSEFEIMKLPKSLDF
jgi:hypothetical protein